MLDLDGDRILDSLGNVELAFEVPDKALLLCSLPFGSIEPHLAEDVVSLGVDTIEQVLNTELVRIP